MPGFEALTPAQKELVYYLSEAAVCGRDIIFDRLGAGNVYSPEQRWVPYLWVYTTRSDSQRLRAGDTFMHSRPRGQAWVGSGKPSSVPDLAQALEKLGIHMDVDESQYLAPTLKHIPVARFVPPAEFVIREA